MDLTNRQSDVLQVIVDGYQSSESPVTAEEVADTVDYHAGTVRQETQSLKALDLVEGIPGPKGGYKPTVNAYKALDRQSLDDTEDLTLAHDYTQVDVTVAEIEFTEVNDPDACRAQVSFNDRITGFDAGDPVVIGPTPSSRLVVAGVIESVDEETNELWLSVTRLEAPLDD